MGKWEKKEKLRTAAYPTKTTSAVPGHTGTADQTAVAVKMKKATLRQVAADMKPLKESTTLQWSVGLRETASNYALNGN